MIRPHASLLRFGLAACFVLEVLSNSPAAAQIGGKPGAFSRLGFGARGIGMGNAMTAVTTGDIVSYYNPALLPWMEYRQASASYGILSLDRTLNFLSFSQTLPPNAGISLGIINSGVTNIDGRDSDGEPTGLLQTSENQFFLGFSARFKGGFSIGLNIKFLYYHLYTDMTSTTVGVDFGALLPVGESLTLGATVRDINSKYKWNTTQLYGQQGGDTEDPFPLLYTIGAAYRLPDSLGIVSGDLEISNASTITTRFGLEVPLIPEITVRAGVDRIDMKEKGNGISPAFGFTARKDIGGWIPAVHYAYVIEPFSPSGTHIISLSVIF